MSFVGGELGFLYGISCLIKDSLAAPGDFILPHLLRSDIKKGQKVVLALVGESLAHYQHVLRKLSVPLQHHIDNRQVAVVDLLASTAESGFSLDSVYDRVVEAAASLRTDGYVTRIVFDDLSELNGICDDCNSNGWTRFLLRLLSLETDTQKLALLVHNDITEDALWIRLLEHHLEIIIRRKEGRASELGNPSTFVPQQDHLYKLTDAGMRLVT